jgi:hypothetical protein
VPPFGPSPLRVPVQVVPFSVRVADPEPVNCEVPRGPLIVPVVSQLLPSSLRVTTVSEDPVTVFPLSVLRVQSRWIVTVPSPFFVAVPVPSRVKVSARSCASGRGVPGSSVFGFPALAGGVG